MFWRLSNTFSRVYPSFSPTVSNYQLLSPNRSAFTHITCIKESYLMGALIVLNEGNFRGGWARRSDSCGRLSLSSIPPGLISSDCLQRDGDLQGVIITHATSSQRLRMHWNHPHAGFLLKSPSLMSQYIFMVQTSLFYSLRHVVIVLWNLQLRVFSPSRRHREAYGVVISVSGLKKLDQCVTSPPC